MFQNLGIRPVVVEFVSVRNQKWWTDQHLQPLSHKRMWLKQKLRRSVLLHTTYGGFLSDCLNLTCVCQLFSVLYSCLVMWSADVFFWPMLSWFSSVLLDTDIKLIYMQFGFTQFPIFCLQCWECHTFICEPWASTSDQLWDLRCLTIAFLVWRNLVNYMKVQKSRKPYK